MRKPHKQILMSSLEEKNRSRNRTNSPSDLVATDDSPLDQLLKTPATTALPALPSSAPMDILGIGRITLYSLI